MKREDLEEYQEQGRVQALYTLVMMCRRRFLHSEDLVGLRSDTIEAIRRFELEASVDLVPLQPAWKVFCERYLDERWTSQLSLFPDEEFDQRTTWTTFIHRHLFPALVRDDEVVRNVLRAVGVLPSKDQANATNSLRLYFIEMAFPDDASLWAHEEELEI